MVFENIKNISIKDKASWRDKIFLTFDVDWASDEVLYKFFEPEIVNNLIVEHIDGKYNRRLFI